MQSVVLIRALNTLGEILFFVVCAANHFYYALVKCLGWPRCLKSCVVLLHEN